MPYYISNSDSSINISLADGVIDTESYSVTLVGRNVSNYGQYFAENSIRMLENFASNVQPNQTNTLIGQLWYDKEKNVLRVWDGAAWKPATGITVEDTNEPEETTGRPSIKQEGAMFFNREDNKLYVYADALTDPWASSYAGEVSSRYNNSSIVGQPNNYGTRLRNIFLQSTVGPKAVLALTYSNDSTSGGINVGSTRTRFGRETIIAIFSDHAPFIIKDTRNLPDSDKSYTEGEYIDYYAELFTDPAGVARKNNGKILPGMNLRDYSAEGSLSISDLASVPNADVAEVSNATLSLAVITGGPNTTDNYIDLIEGTGGQGTISYIDVDNILTSGTDLEPSLDQAFTLGTCDNRWVDTFTGSVKTDAIHAKSNNCGLPNSTDPLSIIGTVTAQGDWNIQDDLNVGGTLTTTEITAGSTATAGTITGAWTLTPGSTMQSTYADLAELYLPDQEYEPGTVVELGGDAEITQTTELASDQVFGVVSTDPAYIMNAGLENGLPVALAGRIPVKVIGPVNKGDRLISSSIHGVAVSIKHADKNYDPTTVIGRSLETNTDMDIKMIEAVVGVR